ncbi:glycosyltransferase family 4 protein [Niabella ginsengisoli]|uniref:Glycosyltransferase family 4 protein n=1 Tax=Niabella ginsengisoli TaxID=522298 RepID=A0ABS9SK32_9BACT|nr:glycosyltransferase family 4 protein [Niabella ginsengisoli]
MCYPDEHVKKQAIKEATTFYPLLISRKFSPISDIMQVVHLCRYIQSNKPDIIHTHSPKAGLVGMLAGWVMRIKCRIHTVAGLPLVEKQGIYKYILISVERLVYACSHVVVFNSPRQAQYVIENGWISPKKVKIIGKGSSNGIDLSYFQKTQAIQTEVNKLRNELAIQKDDLILSFVGRIALPKGIEELVNAFLLLENEYNNLNLILVGSADNVDPISHEIWNIINTNSRIHWLGYKEDVRPYFQITDIFVFPSYREGFPQIIMQAAAMECPIIATDINGANEIIENGKNGLLISPKSTTEIVAAVKKLIEEPDLRNTFSRQSRNAMINGFDQEKFWQGLDDLYKETLNR